MFFERLQLACKLRNTAHSTAVRAVGCSPGMIDGWKKGSFPRADIVKKLADYLDTSADYLLERTDDPTPVTPHVRRLSNEETVLIDGLRQTDGATRCTIIKMASAALSLPIKEETAPAAALAFSRPKDEKISQPKARGQSYKRVEGKAAAGPPISSVPDAETCISVPAKYLSEHYFIVQAQGDSMIDAHIHSGDYCVFQKDGYLDEGRIMFVQVDGLTDTPDAAIKRVFQRGNSIELHSANPKYPPMIYDADSVQLMGILVDVITPDFRCA